MPDIRIEKVIGGKQLNRFLKFPWSVYKGNPNWVPPLLIERKQFFNPAKNPFFDHALVEHFLANRDGKVAGRISAIINSRHNEFHNDKIGFFGFFESINDFGVASRLFDAAAEFLRVRGMDTMRGPCNFSTNDEIGFLVKGYDSPATIMNTYTPEYYLELAERYGMKKAMDLYGYYLDDTMPIAERVVKVAEKVQHREDLVIRKLNLKKLREEVEKVKYIYNKAWEKNWGFVPLTDEEIDHMADDLKMIIDPNIAFFAEVKGNPIGFSLSLPNMNEILIKLDGRLLPTGIFKLLYYMKIHRIVKGVRTLIMGLIPEYRGRGIDNLLYLETIRQGPLHGYHWSEMGWILETNFKMNRAIEALGGRLHKVYRIYDYAL